MKPGLANRILIFTLPFLTLILIPFSGVFARPLHSPAYQSSADELIRAVNDLRIAYGLPPLSIHPVLMQTAQGQADALLATEGAIGHGRPNGITFTQQLIMLGYPLSGDLSLGGYRSENFVFGNQLSAQEAVELWRGDEPHTNTMLSPNRSDIGAGVAVASDGTVYYVIDTALSTRSGAPQSEATLYFPGGSSAAGTVDPQSLLISQYVVPVSINTARPDGDVIHKVQYGQTLWDIAIKYGTTIEHIRRYNNLGSDTTLYEGQVLLIQKGATQPAPSPVIKATPSAIATNVIVPSSTLFIYRTPTHTATLLATLSPPTNAQNSVIVVSLIISFAVLTAGLGLWGGRRKRVE